MTGVQFHCCLLPSLAEDDNGQRLCTRGAATAPVNSEIENTYLYGWVYNFTDFVLAFENVKPWCFHN